MKRRLLSILVCLLYAICGYSQLAQPVYLLQEFSAGEILFHDKSKAKLSMNIDIANNRVLYYQGAVLMEVANVYYADTIKVAGKRFLVRENTPCEVLDRSGYRLLVGWHVKAVNLGQKGALDHTTQASVMNVHVRDMYANAGNEDFDANRTAVWREVKDNTYYLCLDGKEYKLKTLKDIYRQFPFVKSELKKYVRQEKLDIQKPESALQIFDYVVSHHAEH